MRMRMRRKRNTKLSFACNEDCKNLDKACNSEKKKKHNIDGMVWYFHIIVYAFHSSCQLFFKVSLFPTS